MRKVYFGTHYNSNTKLYLYIKMNVQENNGNILPGNGQVQSQSEQAQFGSERAQSHGHVQFGGGQAQSSSTGMAAQMLKNKNKPREEIKPVDKEGKS